MPPSTIAAAANTAATTMRPSWRNASSERSIDGCSLTGAVSSRYRKLTRPSSTATTAITVHATRQDAPACNERPVIAAPRTAPVLNSPWKRTR